MQATLTPGYVVETTRPPKQLSDGACRSYNANLVIVQAEHRLAQRSCLVHDELAVAAR